MKKKLRKENERLRDIVVSKKKKKKGIINKKKEQITALYYCFSPGLSNAVDLPK